MHRIKFWKICTNLQNKRKLPIKKKERKKKEKKKNSVSAKHNNWKTIKRDIPIFYVLFLSVLKCVSKYVWLNIPWFVSPGALLDKRTVPCSIRNLETSVTNRLPGSRSAPRYFHFLDRKLRQIRMEKLRYALSELWEMVLNREAWRAAIHGVAESDMTERLKWTELNWRYTPLTAVSNELSTQSRDVTLAVIQMLLSVLYLETRWLKAGASACS